MLATQTRWRTVLYERLRGQPEPLFIMPRCTIPAASLWASVRLWVDVFRRAGLTPGDRVVVAQGPSVGTLAFLLAALWEDLTVALALPACGSPELLDLFDARLGLGCDGVDADDAGCPVIPQGFSARMPRGPATAEVRLITRTSGTSGTPTWVALSDENLWSVIDSHRAHLSREGDVVLSILPWHHSFGLVIDVLPAVLSASVLVREPSGGREAASIIEAARHWGATWCSMVPLQAQRLAEAPGGLEFLRSLRGGVVGGAAASAGLARVLATTALRAGYGQTEASPGVCLGEPGRWSAGTLGTPRGCEVRVDASGRLLVRGPNVCHGVWAGGRVLTLDPRRWLDTGDVAREEGEDLVYLGRADHSFKLSNGRMVDAARLEHELRRALPGLSDAMVHSRDGARLEVVLVINPGGATPDIRVVRRVLGGLADRLDEIVVRDESPAIRTGKGGLDRARLAAA